jgi:hypothetical protein
MQRMGLAPKEPGAGGRLPPAAAWLLGPVPGVSAAARRSSDIRRADRLLADLPAGPAGGSSCQSSDELSSQSCQPWWWWWWWWW